MNRIFACFILLLVSPILLLVSVLLLCVQGFPVFFTQDRIGIRKEPFKIYKFRTMKNEAITPIGKLIRNLGLDELPQLFNIVKGNMAFIGPRPLTSSDITRLQWNTQYHNTRWIVLPGLTGLAQLSPVCHRKMSWFYDAYYSKHKTFGLDLSIVLQTMLIPFIGKQGLKKLKKK